MNGATVAKPGQAATPLWLRLPIQRSGKQKVPSDVSWSDLYDRDISPTDRRLLVDALNPDDEATLRAKRFAVLDLVLLQKPDAALRALQSALKDERKSDDDDHVHYIEEAIAFVEILQEVGPFAASVRNREGLRSGTMRRVQRTVERQVRKVTHVDFVAPAQGIALWFDGLQKR